MGSNVDTKYEEMGSEELIDRIEKSAEIKDLENSPGWRLIQEACKRAANQAREALSEVDPSDKVLIVKYQQIAKLYGNVLQSLVSSYKQEGLLAFEEAKQRGVIGDFMSKMERMVKREKEA